MILTSDGKVGIGALSPAEALEVSGSITVGIGTLNGHITASGVISASGGFVGDGSNLSNVSATISGETFATDLKIGRDSTDLIDFTTNDNIIFRTANVNRFQMDSAALFPVTDGVSDLGTDAKRWEGLFTNEIVVTNHITSSGNISASGTDKNYFRGTTRIGNSATGLSMGIASTDVFGINGFDVDGSGWNSIHIKADGEDGLFIEKDTNKVGIGTTSPTKPLQVTGDISASGDFYVQATKKIYFGTGDNTYIQESSNDILKFYAGGSEMLVLDDGNKSYFTNGNVGIGTTTPTEKLQVAGIISASGGISSSGTLHISPDVDSVIELGRAKFGPWTSDYMYLSHHDMASNVNYALNQTSAGVTSLNAASGRSIQFKISNDEKMTLASDGKVGIGITSPTSKLTISSGSESTSQTASAAPGTLNANNHYLELYEQTSGSSEVDSGPTLVFASNYYNNDILKSTRAGIRGGTEAVGANAAGFLAFHTNKSAPANNMPERMRIDASGNVGIGTTDPNNPLSVSGSLTVFTANQTSRLTVGEGDDSGESTNNCMIIETTGASNKSRIFTKGTSNDFVIETMGNNSDIHLSSDRDIRFGTNNNTAYNFSEKMIMSSSGNFGIGTSTPGEKLVVAGNISASGAISTESHITASGNISASGELRGATLKVGGKLVTIESATTLNQDLTNDADVEFSSVVLAGTTPLNFIGGANYSITHDAPIDFDLLDNDASALSFDVSGKAGMLEFVTTNGSEKVKMSGDLDVAGAITASGEISASIISASSIHLRDDDSKITFRSSDTYIYGSDGVLAVEKLYIGADDDIVLQPDDDLIIQAGSTTYATFFGEGKARIGSNSEVAPSAVLQVDGDLWITGSNGHITASGNISSSGNVYAQGGSSNGFLLENTTALSTQGGILFVGNSNDWTEVQYGRQDTDAHDFVGSITASGNISSSGNVIGNLYQPTFHNFSMTGTDELYIPFPTSTTEASTTNYVREWIAPFDGALSKIRARGSAAGGNTTFKLYVNAVIAGGATATSDTVNWRFADTTYNFTFDETAAVYSAGDLIRVTVNPTSDFDDANVTMIWNYNTNTV